MDYTRGTSRVARCAIVVFILHAIARGQTQAPSRPNILSLSDAEQVAWVNSYLGTGMTGQHGIDLTMLVLNRGSLVLPILERKIEEVLKSSTPAESFTTKDVDPRKAIGLMASTIEYAGNEEALIQASKLLKIDEKLFDRMVFGTMAAAIANQGNPFPLAYKGFEMGDPSVAKRIGVWAEDILAKPGFDTPGSMRNRWAEILVDRIGRPPVGEEWTNDPIVSRLKPATAAALRADIYRLALATWEKRELIKRTLGMSETEQIAFTKGYLERGMPHEEGDILMALVRNRSMIVLPVIERKIEEIVKSPDPINCFTIKTVRPEVVLGAAGLAIAQAADEQALKQSSKLIKLDPSRFHWLVERTLFFARERGNPFTLAYQGLKLGDSVLDKSIAAWAEQILAEPTLNLPRDPRHQWAQAIVERYGAAPVSDQWAKDPIASKLRPALAESLRIEVVRLATAAAQQRTGK